MQSPAKVITRIDLSPTFQVAPKPKLMMHHPGATALNLSHKYLRDVTQVLAEEKRTPSLGTCVYRVYDCIPKKKERNRGSAHLAS